MADELEFTSTCIQIIDRRSVRHFENGGSAHDPICMLAPQSAWTRPPCTKSSIVPTTFLFVLTPPSHQQTIFVSSDISTRIALNFRGRKNRRRDKIPIIPRKTQQTASFFFFCQNPIFALTKKGRRSDYGKNMRSTCCVLLGIRRKILEIGRAIVVDALELWNVVCWCEGRIKTQGYDLARSKVSFFFVRPGHWSI